MFEKVLKLQGFPIDEAKQELKKRQSLGADSFTENSMKLRASILEYHLANNKTFKKHLASRSISEWNDIPVITKQSFQVDIGSLLSDNLNLKKVYLNNTSGSTGQPFYFAKDKFAHAMTWALIIDRYNRHGIDLNHSLQARFFGIPLSRRGYVKERIKDGIANRVRFPVFDLSENVLDRYIRIFERKPFDYLNGYSSALVLFAKHLIYRNQVLSELCPTLKVCITTSEICTAEDRLFMERAFGVMVVNEYGAAELDLIAFEDENFQWIMSNENLYFEVVDDDNNPVPPGNEGKLLVTSLYNKAIPFIRYELGDRVLIDDNWKGNYQILRHLVGRTNDYAILPSGKKSAGLTFYYISKSILEKGGFVKEFIVKQSSPAQFVFEYVAAHDLDNNQKELVEKVMAKYLESGLECEFIRMDQIKRSPSGKLKHFQRLF